MHTFDLKHDFFPILYFSVQFWGKKPLFPVSRSAVLVSTPCQSLSFLYILILFPVMKRCQISAGVNKQPNTLCLSDNSRRKSRRIRKKKERPSIGHIECQAYISFSRMPMYLSNITLVELNRYYFRLTEIVQNSVRFGQILAGFSDIWQSFAK